MATNGQAEETNVETGTTVDVPPTQPQDEHDDEPTTQASTPPNGNGKSNADRRRERGADRAQVRQAAEDAARQAAEARAEAQRMREELAELRGRMEASTKRDDTTDDYTRRLERLEAESVQQLALVGEGRADFKRYHELQREMRRVESDRAIEEYEKRRGPQVDPVRVALDAEFPWLPSNEKARRWADGAYSQLLAEGRPEGIATMKEAIAAAGAKFGLGGRAPAPAPTQRGAYYGVPTADSGAADRPTTVRLDPMTMKIAEAKYPDLPPDQAYRKFAAFIAPKLRGGA